MPQADDKNRRGGKMKVLIAGFLAEATPGKDEDAWRRRKWSHLAGVVLLSLKLDTSDGKFVNIIFLDQGAYYFDIFSDNHAEISANQGVYLLFGK